MTIRGAVSYVLTAIPAAGILICRSDADTTKRSEGRTSSSVLEHHNSPRRDGVYVDLTLTRKSASTFHIDPMFKARGDPIRHGATDAEQGFSKGENSDSNFLIM